MFGDLSLVTVARGAVRRLTRGLRAYDPDVAPDGRSIVFARKLGDRSELSLVGIDGLGLRTITASAMGVEWRARLKRLYGDRLSFWGSIDEQRTLPFGTPAEVRREVETRLRTLGRGGGLIIGPTHYVQLDTPLENFWAMVDAITGTPSK